MSERVIKFRAWSKPYRRMYDVTMFQWSAAVPGELNKMELLSLDELHEIRNVYDQAIQDNYVLMQYTGLQDKNGNEGYEDDLVKLFNRSIFAIVWDEYYARFQLELVSGNEHKKVWDMGMLQQGEIVGNRFENPDLLSE